MRKLFVLGFIIAGLQPAFCEELALTGKDIHFFLDSEAGSFYAEDPAPKDEKYKYFLFCDNPPTSYITLILNDKPYRLNDSKVKRVKLMTETQRAISGVFSIEDVVFTVSFILTNSAPGEKNNAVICLVSIDNKTETKITAGARFLFDTYFDERWGTPYIYLSSTEQIQYERLLLNQSLPEFVFCGEYDSDYKKFSEGLFIYPSLNQLKPDSIIIGNWQKLEENELDYKIQPNEQFKYNSYANKDAAVAVLYTGIYINANQTINIGSVISRSKITYSLNNESSVTSIPAVVDSQNGKGSKIKNNTDNGKTTGDNGKTTGDKVKTDPVKTTHDKGKNDPVKTTGDKGKNDPVKTTGDDTTEPVKTTGDDTTEPVKTTGDDTTEPVKTTGDDTTEPVKTTGDDTTEPVKTTGDDTTEPVKTTDDDTTEPVKTTGDTKNGKNSGKLPQNTDVNYNDMQMKLLTRLDTLITKIDKLVDTNAASPSVKTTKSTNRKATTDTTPTLSKEDELKKKLDEQKKYYEDELQKQIKKFEKYSAQEKADIKVENENAKITKLDKMIQEMDEMVILIEELEKLQLDYKNLPQDKIMEMMELIEKLEKRLNKK